MVEKLLALLIINKVEKSRNSYELCKVLAWKFNIIEFVDTINFLVSNEFIDRVEKDGFSFYNMTSKGIDYLKEREKWLYEEVLKRFPDQTRFINLIWENEDVGVK
jgi:hypothetical protein